MKRIIPFIGSKLPSLRSSTMKNLETFIAIITSYVNTLALDSMGPAILSLISRTYYRIHHMVMEDPINLIKQMKSAQAWWLLIVRGLPMSGSHPFDSENNFFSPYTVGETRKNSFLGLRLRIANTNNAYLLLAFDRVVYWFLALHRIIVTPFATDFSSITSPRNYDTKGSNLITDEELSTALSNLGISQKEFMLEYKKRAREQKHILLSSAGPNGKATWTAYSDAIALLNDRDVLNPLRSFAEQSGMSRFIEDMASTVCLPGSDVSGGARLWHSKIHTFEEWGGKTRHVAIIDYWTQLILTPLHDTLFHFLRRIDADATFDQNGACEYIRKLTAMKGLEVYSVDLTAATDRLPADLQVRVLTKLTGNHTLADAWAKIFTTRSFKTVDNTTIKYGVGLPMGSKSNWAMLAITHHLIIQIAALRANAKLPYETYRVCGDDSVLTHHTVYTKYYDIMTAYGLVINLTKSVLHSENLLSAAEFCKRVFVAGNELTIPSPKLSIRTSMNGRLATQLQDHLFERGNSLTGTSLYSFLGSLIDRESLEFTMLLNVIPQSLSGLRNSVNPGGQFSHIGSWYGNLWTLDDQTLIDAYTYVVVTEQLKRLDTLLRQTDLINSAIQSRAVGYTMPSLSVEIKTAKDEHVKLYEWLGLKSAELSGDHPVVQASYDEAIRISSLLAALKSGDKDISATALSRLLDSFRNALVEAWLDKEDARAQADRTLITKAMELISKIVNQPQTDKETKKARVRKVDFTVSLAYIGRLWTVQWELGQRVAINAVKSRIKTDPVSVKSLLDTTTQTPAIFSRFNMPRDEEETKVDS